MNIEQKMLIAPTLEPVGDLSLNVENPRKADFSKIKQLAKKIEIDPQFFARRPILVNVTEVDGVVTKTIYAGEQRYTAATKVLKMTEVPCILDYDLPKEVMDRRMALDNKHEGAWDEDMFIKLFTEEQAKEWGFNEFKFPSDYENQLAKFDDTRAEMPIVPKYNEKYNSVIIFCENELDMNWLRNVLQLEKMQCYKASRIGETYVINVKHLQQVISDRED